MTGARGWPHLGWLLTALTIASCSANDTGNDGNDKVIPLTARRWSYDPPSITLKLGEPVILEISSDDVHHGFNLPTFNLRADAIPGMKTRVKVVPDKTGTFAFYCDYYCGSGHEGMAGQLVVE